MENSGREQLRIVIVGHVDHGKSTLIGRLFHDTGSLPEGKFEQIKKTCESRGMEFEWAFLMDALQAERDQNVTIDTSHIWLRSSQRDYVIIDAPGHREFLKNMVSGAAASDAALIVIDASEGVKEQSRRHGFLLHLLGIRQVAVVVNKMDMVGFSREKFNEVKKEFAAYLNVLKVKPEYFIPVSARAGDNITELSNNMPWYHGETVIGALAAFTPKSSLAKLPLRLPVQDIYRFDSRRILAGRIESGQLKVGDTILFSPSNKTTKVKSFECWNSKEEKLEATAGESVGITLEEQLFAERGDIISHTRKTPVLNNHLRSRIFWVGDNELKAGNKYKIKIQTSELKAEVEAIESVTSTDTLQTTAATVLKHGEVGEVVFKVKGLAALDDFEDNPKTGRFVIVDGYDIAGGGIINLENTEDLRAKPQQVKSSNIFVTDLKITSEERARLNGHSGGILWFTGLSGSGKSTLALELQQRLFAKGYQVYVLDGDNIRRGLNADLDFSPKSRSENIRRVGEVAALFADAGFIVITAFISPYREDRKRVHNAAPKYFNTIYVKCDVETCETRDPKGLYKKARAGEISDFTGINAPYEEPENPDLEVDTSKQTVEESVDQLMQFVERNFVQK